MECLQRLRRRDGQRRVRQLRHQGGLRQAEGVGHRLHRQGGALPLRRQLPRLQGQVRGGRRRRRAGHLHRSRRFRHHQGQGVARGRLGQRHLRPARIDPCQRAARRPHHAFRAFRARLPAPRHGGVRIAAHPRAAHRLRGRRGDRAPDAGQARARRLRLEGRPAVRVPPRWRRRTAGPREGRPGPCASPHRERGGRDPRRRESRRVRDHRLPPRRMVLRRG